jgi:hypothetical protein
VSSAPRASNRHSPLKIDEQALLGVSGECGERQVVLNYNVVTMS